MNPGVNPAYSDNFIFRPGRAGSAISLSLHTRLSHCPTYPPQSRTVSSIGFSSRVTVRAPALTPEAIVAALEANDHHIANTARELGLERSHLYKKMRALGIDHRGAEDEA